MARIKNLSLCMITYNDEQNIENCLLSIKEFVDEIIVIDIGSNDLTINKAKQMGANVYHMKWNYSHSEAKNLCLDQAKGRWVLFLQANEIISKEQLKNIRLLLDNPNVEGYLLDIDYNFQKHRIHSPVQSLRLLRNRKEYRFKYRVFERIPDEILSNIKDSGIQILQQSNHNLSSEFGLFTLLLEEDMAQFFEDSYLQYIYGIELLNQKRYEESIVYFERARKNVNYNYLFASHLYKCLSWGLITIKRYGEALDILEEGIKVFPFYSDLFVLRGEIRKQFKQYNEAIKDLERSLIIREQAYSIIPKSEIDTSVILEALGDIHKSILNYRQASTYYQQAYKINDRNKEILYKIGKLAKRINSFDVLENILKVAIEEKNPEKLVILMDIFFQQREYTRVLAITECLEYLIGKGEESKSIKFTCYLMLGDLEKAKLCFSDINKDSPFYNHMLLQFVEKYWANNQWQEAKQLLEEIDKKESIDSYIKVLYNALHQLLNQKELDYTLVTAQEYEIVNSLIENFLWLGQQDKAQLLLSLILKGREEEQCLCIAEAWVEINDYDTIEKIFYFISSKQNQQEFKQKIAMKLLYSGHIKTAQKIINLGDFQMLEGLEHVVWAENFMKKIKQWLDMAIDMNTNFLAAKSLDNLTLSKPSKDLMDFYYSLDLDNNNPRESAYDSRDENLTNAKIYEGIGNFYLRSSKYKEALTSYLNIIQCDPLNQIAQERILDIFQKKFAEYMNFVEKKYWFIEGSYFKHRQDYFNYTMGYIHFKNNQIEEALAYFIKIEEYEPINAIAFAYIISGFMISGKEEKAVRWLSEKKGVPDIIILTFHICRNYVLDILNKECKDFLPSELLELVKQRISDISKTFDLN